VEGEGGEGREEREGAFEVKPFTGSIKPARHQPASPKNTILMHFEEGKDIIASNPPGPKYSLAQTSTF
jgi:hypothetical protein